MAFRFVEQYQTHLYHGTQKVHIYKYRSPRLSSIYQAERKAAEVSRELARLGTGRIQLVTYHAGRPYSGVFVPFGQDPLAANFDRLNYDEDFDTRTDN